MLPFRSFAAVATLVMSTLSSAAELQPGQVWAYKTRPGEEGSTLTVLKVEKYPKLGSVVHVRVDGVHVNNPVKGNVVTAVPHLPFKEAPLKYSLTRLLSQAPAVPDFQAGYDAWKKAYAAGQAGAFGTSVSATLDGMLDGDWEEK